jgi:hypothetical protein
MIQNAATRFQNFWVTEPPVAAKLNIRSVKYRQRFDGGVRNSSWHCREARFAAGKNWIAKSAGKRGEQNLLAKSANKNRLAHPGRGRYLSATLRTLSYSGNSRKDRH